MTLVEFLTARLDELAPEVHQYHESRCLAGDRCGCGLPEWMAADIAVKREIVKWCGERDQIWVGTIASDPELPKPSEFVPGRLKNAADSIVLRFLASIYSDHPDYREEWKP